MPRSMAEEDSLFTYAQYKNIGMNANGALFTIKKPFEEH